MNLELHAFLKGTLDDKRLSRAEKKALAAFVEASGRNPLDISLLRHRAFELARESIGGSAPTHEGAFAEILEWLEDVVKVLANEGRPADRAPKLDMAEAFFSPGNGCLNRILSLFDNAERTADVCVFTITDDRISRAIASAHKRGVRIRLLTDDDKRADAGSDIALLARHGIEVRTDRTEYHMHHKFAIFDGEVLLNGSYNWTRGAAEYNEENLVVLTDPRLVSRFCAQFDSLWTALA